MAEAVVVGMRIRPFNARETALKARLCISMSGAQTNIKDVEGFGEKSEAAASKDEGKTFTFDQSFWSHDGFTEDKKTGMKIALPGSQYADQTYVFESFGKRVLDNAWAGYHCCLFAYGQTGAGKSYSMVGYGADRGIVPMACDEIFRRISSNPDEGLTFEVNTSMVEIYNEAVQDLLVMPKNRPKKGLEIRESKQLGIYVDGVVKRLARSYAEIEAITEEGTNNRTVGSTLMNATSSRAHTVITIEFKQISTAGGASGQKVSVINLVDLAGSEKAGQTGASGDRLKEGCAINKSLSALGNVIEKLAEKSSGKAKPGAIIPYRDSKLTRLLQNALGGSSKTIMICAISPASSNYEETMSTLRYADRAKRIKNAAVVNENPQDRMIRQLREENQKLKEMLSSGGGGGPQDSGGDRAALKDKQKEVVAMEEALKSMQQHFSAQLQEAQQAAQAQAEQAQEFQKAHRQAEAQAKEVAAKEADKKAAEHAEQERKRQQQLTLPHLANLNEDEMLQNRLQFFFPERKICTVGRGGDGAGDPDVEIRGPGIQREHGTVTNDSGTCRLVSFFPNTCINGESVGTSGSKELKHGDRVAFGQCMFVFVEPSQGQAADLLAAGGAVSYAQARKELQTDVGGPSEEDLKKSQERAVQLEEQVRQAQEAKTRAEEEASQRLQQQEAEYQARLQVLQEAEEKRREEARQAKAQQEQNAQQNTEVPRPDTAGGPDAPWRSELDEVQRQFKASQRMAEEEAQKKIQELERQVQSAARAEEDHRHFELNMRMLEEQLMHVLPLVKEANLIAEELRRPHRLEAKMQVDLSGERANRGAVRVAAAVTQDGVRLYEWSPETLENRVFMMRDLLQRCIDEGTDENVPKADDPFWDPVNAERAIGAASVLLEGLLLQVENRVDARILSAEGHQVGTLRVELWPVSKDGELGVPDEEVVDDPDELLGSCFPVLVRVVRASGLPKELANDPRVQFSFFYDGRPHEVPPAFGFNCDPQFDFEDTLVQETVTTRFLEYLRSKTMIFHVFGKDAEAMKFQQRPGATPREAMNGSSAARSTTPRGATPRGTPRDATPQEPAPPEPVPLAVVEPGQVPADPQELPPTAPDPSVPAPAQEAPEPEAVEQQPKVPSLAELRQQTEQATKPLEPEPTSAAAGPGGKKSKACSIL